jgi:hypothetical protein
MAGLEIGVDSMQGYTREILSACVMQAPLFHLWPASQAKCEKDPRIGLRLSGQEQRKGRRGGRAEMRSCVIMFLCAIYSDGLGSE